MCVCVCVCVCACACVRTFLPQIWRQVSGILHYRLAGSSVVQTNSSLYTQFIELNETAGVSGIHGFTNTRLYVEEGDFIGLQVASGLG